MRLAKTALIAGLLFPVAAQALSLSRLRFDKPLFEPGKGETVAVSFDLSEPAKVQMLVWDGRDLLIRRIESAGSLAAGDQTIVWDGKDERGGLVPPEAYRVTLQATTTDGETVVHDLTDVTGGQTLGTREAEWNPATGRVSFTLPAAARLNIRAGMVNDGPLLRTIIDWVARPSGHNEASWDGWDASRVLDLSQHPQLGVVVDAFALSDNTVVVGPLSDRIELLDLPADTLRRQPGKPARKLMHEHSQQPLDRRGDFAVTLRAVGEFPRDTDGVLLISGKVPFQLDVEPHDRQRVIDQRLEPVFFVDGTFVFENEVGFLPTTWIWNTATANEGDHYISANARGYEGNFGMATIKVRVKHAKADHHRSD